MATTERNFADKTKTNYEITQCNHKLPYYREVAAHLPAELNMIKTIEHELEKRKKGVENSTSSRAHFVNYTHARILTIHTKACYELCKSSIDLDGLTGDACAALKQSLNELRPAFAVIPHPDKLDWEKYMHDAKEVTRLHYSVAEQQQRALNEKRAALMAAFNEYAGGGLPTRAQLDGFMVIVERHDSYYSYSDDITVYRRGEAQRKAIIEHTHKHPIFKDAWETYNAHTGADDQAFAASMANIRARCAI